MLYPKEDRVLRKLLFVCRRCNYEQDAETPVVYRHELVRSAVCVTAARTTLRAGAPGEHSRR